MRKILLLTLAFVFAGVSVAGATKINVGDATNPPSILDIRLQEGFENGGAIPAGWTDSPGANPWLYGDGTYWNQDWSPGAPHSGSYTAYFPFWDTPSGIADSLMTPSMDLSGGAGQFVLRYWSWYPNSYASDSVVVYLKEGDVLNRIHKMPVSDLNPFLIPWTQNIVPFNTLSNDAKIVFVMYTGDWGYGMTIPYIDDIKVYDAPITARCCYGDVHAPSCADNSLAECNALGGTWEPYLSCEEDPCPATPANDQCSEAQAIVGPYPQTITGTNINATVDCPGFLDDGWNGVWYTIELPYASNHLTIDFSPTCALIDSLGVDRIGNAWMPNCDCTERHEFDNLEWGYCYPAWDNFYTYYYPVLSAVIEGPTTIYFPCNVGQTPRDFAFTVDVKNYVPPTPDFQITAARGTWADPSQTTCGAGNDCPWHPSEDQLWEITIPYDDSVWIFSLCNTAQNWNAQNQVNGMGSRMMIGTSPCDGGIAENEGACDGLSQFSANLNAGTYYLTIEGSHPGDCGYYQLDIDIAPPPPPNDNCENVTPSELAIGSTVTFTGDNTNATNDCENDSYNQVWEAFTTTELANIAIDYCGTPPYTDDDSPGFRLSRINSYIFSGCPCGDRYFRASGDDATCPDGMRTNYFNFLPAGTYYIPIRYRDPQARGPYTINVTATAVPPAPENNDCANAQAIGDVTDLVFNTTTATYDGSGDCIFSPNIWYLYTASATGRIKAALCGSSYDTKLAVWSGSDCATSTIVGCNDDSCEVGSIVVFDAVVGSQYLIEVGGSGPSYGEGLLTVGPLPAACNYVVGDCNNSGGFNGVDVVYAVSYFKGGSAPEYTCECTPGNSWYVAGDVNASCNFNGVDVTYAVSYFKGGLPPHPCADCPPPGFLKVGDKGAPSSLPSDNNGAN
jgi:hypothetical protein